MSLLEAMSCGKAVIASSVGENDNIIQQNKNGILVKPGDVLALRLAIERLVNDSELRLQCGRNARVTVTSHYSSLTMTKKYKKLYVEMAGV